MLEAVVETVAPQAATAPAKTTIAVENLNPQVEVVGVTSAEAAPSKEERKPTLWEEIKSTGKVMVNQAVAEVQRLIEEAAGDKGKIDMILKDPKNSVLFNIGQIRALQAGQVASFNSVDKQVTITDANGWVNTIVGIQSIDGKTFYAVVIDEHNKVPHPLSGNDGKPTVVGLQDLEQAHLLQKLAPQLGSLPESQGKIISLYLESVKTGKEPTTLPDDAEKMLLEAATSAGILTTKDVELLLNRVLPEEKPEPDATAAEIATMKENNEKAANKRARLLKPFADQGIIITDPKQIVGLLNGLGVGSVQLSEVRNQAALEATRLDLLIKANEKKLGQEIEVNGRKVKVDKEMLRQWQEEKVKAEEFSSSSQEIIEAFNKDGPIKQYFDELNAGTLSQETGKKIVESFQTGEITKPPDLRTAADAKSRAKLEKMHKVWRNQDAMEKSGRFAKFSLLSALGALGAFGFMAATKKES
ncbi:MAG: hypothetical protein WC744_01920 [Patescibacteria group bacterium]|jgi:hypothetical protein